LALDACWGPITRVSKQSTIFHFAVDPTVQSEFEMIADLTNRLGTEIQEITLPIPDEEEEDVPSIDARERVNVADPGKPSSDDGHSSSDDSLLLNKTYSFDLLTVAL
jgi:hypothetical protein